MGKKRHTNADDVLGSATLTANDDATRSSDLSSMTRAVAFITESDSTPASVDLRAEISPDAFSVSDASATWFHYWSSTSTDYQTVDAGESLVMQLPPSTDSYADGNINPPCGRRMRVVKQSGSGEIGTCMIMGHRMIG